MIQDFDNNNIPLQSVTLTSPSVLEELLKFNNLKKKKWFETAQGIRIMEQRRSIVEGELQQMQMEMQLQFQHLEFHNLSGGMQLLAIFQNNKDKKIQELQTCNSKLNELQVSISFF
ncbi:hypothetical protein RFI_36079 [Reticulomyxa filosa]|uniref:Uncharacterized protein n=1 Tax=Reticulomyxa filosa TaxID=46433 RepID=X6LKY8_RETFI|nr:hypothetical protein RFI_36079 [Reticulomyxa filosa]|eukprot:ETO01360.1 hypothetical protein RFI_36079 [Reticulomyxa filosa]